MEIGITPLRAVTVSRFAGGEAGPSRAIYARLRAPKRCISLGLCSYQEG